MLSTTIADFIYDIFIYYAVNGISMYEKLAEKMAGEIVLSDQPGMVIKKWRELFEITPQQLAKNLGISVSVISDYELGRRSSPGSRIIKKFVNGLIDIDIHNGAKYIKMFSESNSNEAIISMREFPTGIMPENFIELIDGELVAGELQRKTINGYTILDSVKAIMSIDSSEFRKVYGWSNERALVFMGVKYGRSPMIAVRAHPIKPGMVVFHRPERIDVLAMKLAEIENIPLVRTDMDTETMIKKMEKEVIE